MRNPLFVILSLLLLLPVASALEGSGFNVSRYAGALQGGTATGGNYSATTLLTEQPGYLVTCNVYSANIGAFESTGGVCQDMQLCGSAYIPKCGGIASCDTNACDGCSATAASCTANLACVEPSNAAVYKSLRSPTILNLNSSNLSMLADAAVGTTTEKQTLSFGPQQFGVNYVENDDNIIGDYLVIDSSQPFLNHTMTFTPALAGAVNGSAVPSLLGLKLAIMDESYTITDVAVNTTTGNVLLVLNGTKRLEFSDRVNDTTPGYVEIDYENINDADLYIYGALNNTTLVINSITYALTSDAASGAIVYLPAGEDLRGQLSRPQSLLGKSWNILYDGLNATTLDAFAVEPVGTTQYNLRFTNRNSRSYNFTLVSNASGVFRFGNTSSDLVFVEANASSNPNIGQGDVFIISKARSDIQSAETNVLRYDSVNVQSKTLTFVDLGTGNNVGVTYSVLGSGIGKATLRFADFDHDVYLENADNASASHRIAVDLNADNALTGASVNITTKHGAVFTIATLSNGTTQNVSRNHSGDGKNITSFSDVGVWLSVPAALAGGSAGERYAWTILSGPNVSMSLSSIGYSGVRMNMSGEYSRFDLTDSDDDTHKVGMTDYGMLINITDPAGQVPESVLFTIPASQRTAKIRFTTNPSCITPVCGNGIKEAGEACDEGSSNGACPSTCSATCTVSICAIGGRSGGGGGTPSITHEAVGGKVEASDARLWYSVEPGDTLTYPTRNNLSLTRITLQYSEFAELVRINVRQFKERPATVPEAAGAYRYFYIEHQGLDGAANKSVEFTVTKEWLMQKAAGQTVTLYRLESSKWVGYDAVLIEQTDDLNRYRTALPGFSYLAIGLKGGVAAPAATTNEPQLVSAESYTPPVVQAPAPVVQDAPVTSVITTREKKSGLSLWTILGGVVAVLILGLVGLQYFRNRGNDAGAASQPMQGTRPVPGSQPMQFAAHQPVMHVEQPRDFAPEHDPAMAVHNYIVAMRGRGASDDEIRARLLKVGWDELVVDMELMRK